MLIECEVLGAKDNAEANKVGRGDGCGWHGRAHATGGCYAPHVPSLCSWQAAACLAAVLNEGLRCNATLAVPGSALLPRWPRAWWGPAWPSRPSLGTTPTGAASPPQRGEWVRLGESGLVASWLPFCLCCLLLQLRTLPELNVFFFFSNVRMPMRTHTSHPHPAAGTRGCSTTRTRCALCWATPC